MVAIFFDTEATNGKEHPFLSSLKVKQIHSAPSIVVDEIPLMTLTQQLSTQKIINYQGSLTTPPCTEDVEWLILPTPIHMSKAQLQEFTVMWQGNSTFAGGNGNNREVIPLNGRKIYSKGILMS